MVKQWLALCLCGVITVQGVAQRPSSGTQALSREIDALLNQPFIRNATWSIVIESLTRGDTLYSLNGEKGLVPASNMKLFTSAFVLDQLGPDFTYKTTLWAQGRFENDTTLDGNLILRGQGDPTLGGRFRDDKMLQIFEEWTDSVKARKIKVICGHVIGDDNFFSDDIMGRHWEWDSESYWYSAQVSGLCFNDNCIDWYITPGKPGHRARVLVMPNTNYVDIRNRTLTISSPVSKIPVDVTRERVSNVFTATGQIPADAGTLVGWATVENPTWYTATVFKEVVEKSGIQTHGQALDIDSVPGFRYDLSDSNMIRLATYESPKMSEILKVVNKRSQNLYAEQILRTVPAIQTGVGSGDSAIAMEKRFLDFMGIATDKMTITDGSGYARTNQVSTQHIVQLLRSMRRHKYWKTFRESLPVAGVDGTLTYRMKGTVAQGNVRAKTGYVDKVRSISGYLVTANGEELVFSMICNNFTIDKLDVEKIQDTILVRLAGLNR